MSVRTAKACLKCRSQKMRCIGAENPPCNRCRRMGSTCEFVPRANSSRLDLSEGDPSVQVPAWGVRLGSRIHKLERENAALRKQVSLILDNHQQGGSGLIGPDDRPRNGDRSPKGVTEALEMLRRDLPEKLANSHAWNEEIVTVLWKSFQEHMPGLHFLSNQVFFSTPSPLLAVGILYVAAAHHPQASFAENQSTYLEAFGWAVGTFALPKYSTMAVKTIDRRNRFDDILGVVLVGLLAIGWVDTVGFWATTAYRVFLDCIGDEGENDSPEWRGLWDGLRTMDMEHCSLRLTAPALPTTLPDSSRVPEPVALSQSPAGGDIGALLLVMQRRMMPFVGRGLTTPWDRVQAETPGSHGSTAGSLNPDDVNGLRQWVAEIDEWYAAHASTSARTSPYARGVVLLNYYLHKIYVLSLAYTPTQDEDRSTFSELLEASRQALSVMSAGFDVWSSWDLIMLTNACIFLLDGISSGQGQAQDVDLIQYHLRHLQLTKQPRPNLKATLAKKLETATSEILSRAQLRMEPGLEQTLAPRPTTAGLALPRCTENSMKASLTSLSPENGEQSSISAQLHSMNWTHEDIPDLADGQMESTVLVESLAVETGFEWPPLLHEIFGQVTEVGSVWGSEM